MVNAAANRRVADLLELGGEQRVLELGFGGGAAIASTVARLDQTGDLYAVDLSPDMAGQARKAFADLVDSGRLHFACADVAALPLRASTLDHAYAIHSHMYWPNPLAGVKEFRRVLRPGGRLLLAMGTGIGLTLIRVFGLAYQPVEPPALIELLRTAGFTDVASHHLTRNVIAVMGHVP